MATNYSHQLGHMNGGAGDAISACALFVLRNMSIVAAAI